MFFVFVKRSSVNTNTISLTFINLKCQKLSCFFIDYIFTKSNIKNNFYTVHYSIKCDFNFLSSSLFPLSPTSKYNKTDWWHLYSFILFKFKLVESNVKAKIEICKRKHCHLFISKCKIITAFSYIGLIYQIHTKIIRILNKTKFTKAVRKPRHN